METNKLLLAIVCLVVLTITPVVNAQQGNVSAGGDISGTGGSMSFSVGQTDYLHYTSEEGSISFGLQQAWINIHDIPPILDVPDTTIGSGESFCFNATETVILGGNGKEFVVDAEGHADVIAGHNIILKHGTQIKTGGSFHARISTDWCYPDDELKRQPLAVIEDEIITDKSFPVTLPNDNQENPFSFRIYPNPGNGIFTIEFPGSNADTPTTIMVFSLMGALITSIDNQTGHTITINIMDAQPGIYQVMVRNDSFSGTAKLIKH
jgi:hypothetical protein